jgi:pyruvate dehydrogenase E2 component (dihydrolipoamide acetyltransferase)
LSTNVIMPVLGMLQDSGRIIRWLKKTGDSVKKGEILLEVETDKSVQELEAPASGILAQVLAQEDEDVPVTRVIAVIATLEEYRSVAPDTRVALSQTESEEKTETSGNSRPLTLPTTLASPSPLFGKIPASPKARRLAHETNLDLATLRGSGPHGAILAGDVESYLALAPDTPTQVTNESASAIQPASRNLPQVQPAVPLPASQPRIDHPSPTWQTTSYFTLQRQLDLTHFLYWLEVVKQNHHAEVSIADLLKKAISVAVSDYPALDLAWKDSSFALHDLGQFGVDAYGPALDDAHLAGLGMGRLTEQVIPFHGVSSIRPTLTITLACNPCLIDDLNAARFLASLSDMLEEPFLLIT